MHAGPVTAGKRPVRWVLAWLLAASAGPAGAETLQQVFERAWASFPQGRTLEAKQDEVAASRSAAGALFPEAPQVGLSQRSDRWHDNRGSLESEVEVSLPLWLPGQKAARQAVAEREGDENRSAIAAARLALAGELRTVLWELQLARSEAEIAAKRVETAVRLEADVERRVKVGDMARADLLLARQETAAARVAAAEAQGRVVRATQRYRVVTGSDVLPDNPEEPVTAGGSPDPAQHPDLAAARAVAERARAGLSLAQESRRDAPALGVMYRRERDAAGAAASDSVRFGITIPFATEARNAPLIAAGNTALIQGEAEYRRRVAEVEANAREAEARLETARLRADLAGEREQAAAERLALMRRSFELGETALAELLRAQSQANEAHSELARSRVQLSAARANLNQARGITP